MDNKHFGLAGYKNKSAKAILRFFVYLAAGILMYSLNPFGLSDKSDKFLQDTLYAVFSPLYDDKARDNILILLVNETSIESLYKQRFIQANEWPILYSDHAAILSSLLKYVPRSLFVDIYFKKRRSTDDSHERMLSRLYKYGTEKGISVSLAGGYADEDLSDFQETIARTFLVSVNGWTLPEGQYPLRVSGKQTVASLLYADACLSDTPYSACKKSSDNLPDKKERISVIWGGTPAEPIIKELSAGDCNSNSIWDYMKVLNLFSDYEKIQCPFHPVLYADDLVYIDRYGNDEQRAVLKQAIEDKIVIYGTHFEGLHDLVYSPVHGNLPGLMLHAMALDNLITYGENFVKVSNQNAALASLLSWILISVIMTYMTVFRSPSDKVKYTVAAMLMVVYSAFTFFILRYEPMHAASYFIALIGVIRFGDKLFSGAPMVFERLVRTPATLYKNYLKKDCESER